MFTLEHRVADEIAPIKYSIKDEYKDQFEKAIEVAGYQRKAGQPANPIS